MTFETQAEAVEVATPVDVQAVLLSVVTRVDVTVNAAKAGIWGVYFPQGWKGPEHMAFFVYADEQDTVPA